MKRLGHIALITFVLAGAACGGSNAPPPSPVSIYSDDAIVINRDLAQKMKSSAMKEAEAATTMTYASERDLYNPQAEIQVDLLAQGLFTPVELLTEARKTENTPYAICLVLAGLQNAISVESSDQARQTFMEQYDRLLEYLRQRKIPTLACEILPIIPDYQKRGFKLPAQEINELIVTLNRDLYGLALQRADGFVFTHKVFAGRIGLGRDSLILNEANSGNANGIQPTIEGMRLLGQLFARALHKAGYRGGRVLILGDATLSNQALTRPIDKIDFLLPKYLEIELNKSLVAEPQNSSPRHVAANEGS